jgi:F-type H+-transporting ATPase subunit c
VKLDMKTFKLMALAVFAFLLFAVPALAQPTGGSYTLAGASVGAGLGAAFTIIGAGYGFGKIGAAALDGMARQPEVAPRIQTGMIIIAALLEGATFFALIVCIIVAGKVVTTGSPV